MRHGASGFTGLLAAIIIILLADRRHPSPSFASVPNRRARCVRHRREAKAIPPALPRQPPVQQAAQPEDPLDQDLLRFASAVLPRKKDIEIKAKLSVLQIVTKAAKKLLGDATSVHSFGSAANGCGERTADLDLVIHVAPGGKPAGLQSAKDVLRKIAYMCKSRGLVIEEFRLFARIPIIMLRTQTGTVSVECDVSFQNLFPIYNTRLLRDYSLLDSRLPVIVMMVKRWAKALGLAKTTDGYLSSYGWTQMVVYFFQVREGLPSLHALAGETARNSSSFFATNWASIMEASGALPQVASRSSPGQLLRAFFEFYSNDYDWEQEVVSVRLGNRKKLDDMEVFAHLRRTDSQLNVEDPIDLRRNLNFALTARGNVLKEAITTASEELHNGSTLPPELMNGIPALPRDLRGGAEAVLATIDGYLTLPAAGKKLIVQCSQCSWQGDYIDLEEHELAEHGESTSRRRKPIRSLSKNFPYSCLTCGQSYKRMFDLEQHHNATNHSGVVVFQTQTKKKKKKKEAVPLSS